jgi:Uma2 family endonuclease
MAQPVPVLHAGDHLTRREFERRFDATPGLKKAELIDGTVYVAAPVNHTYHGGPHTLWIGWLGFYVAETPGLDLGAESSLRFDEDNMPQPDALLRVPEHAGGRSRIDREGYVVGPPELIVEVAASAVSYDLHQKFEVYRRTGVREYVVQRTEDAAIDWFLLREGRYVRQEPGADGLLRSAVFPGLWLDVAAMQHGDLRALRAAVERGIVESGHAAFARDVAPA